MLKNLFELLESLTGEARKIAVAIVVMLAMILIGARASAQTYLTPVLFTNVVTAQAVTAGATSNVISAPIPVNPGFGFGLTVKMHNALTSAVTNGTVNINVTYDGTNYPSPATYSIEIPHVANTTNFWYTNMPAAWFDGAMDVRVDSVTNNDSANIETYDQVTLSRKRLDY